MNEDEKFFCKLCCREITPDINNTYKGYCKSCYNEKFNINQPERKLYQNWCFWLLIIIILIFLCFGINSYIENKKLEETFSHIGNGASDYIKGIENSESYLNKFSYNYITGTVDYNP